MLDNTLEMVKSKIAISFWMVKNKSIAIGYVDNDFFHGVFNQYVYEYTEKEAFAELQALGFTPAQIKQIAHNGGSNNLYIATNEMKKRETVRELWTNLFAENEDTFRAYITILLQDSNIIPVELDVELKQRAKFLAFDVFNEILYGMQGGTNNIVYRIKDCQTIMTMARRSFLLFEEDDSIGYLQRIFCNGFNETFKDSIDGVSIDNNKDELGKILKSQDAAEFDEFLTITLPRLLAVKPKPIVPAFNSRTANIASVIDMEIEEMEVEEEEEMEVEAEMEEEEREHHIKRQRMQ